MTIKTGLRLFCLFLLTGHLVNARASDLVGSSVTLPGYRFSISRIIPSRLPSVEKGLPSYQESQESTEDELKNLIPKSRMMFQHYASGGHPFSRYISLLQLSDSKGDSSDCFEPVNTNIGEFCIFVKKGTPTFIQWKIRYDFLLSQLSKGGAIASEWFEE